MNKGIFYLVRIVGGEEKKKLNPSNKLFIANYSF